jgi:voltage-gated sodium channel
MSATLRKIAEAAWFQNFVTAAIIFAGVLVGIETYPSLAEKYGSILHILDTIILIIFILEIVVKMGAEGNKPWRYFLDPWNVFDFTIVAVCLIPGLGQYAVVLRLARLLRVLKLVTALPKLQLLVAALLKSIPSMFYVSVLLFLLFYLYAVAAVFMFGENDPIHFGNLQISLLSLFRAVTLEDWTDLMYIQMYGCANYGYGGSEALCTASNATPVLGALFFVSFVLIGTMIVLNLFIGVIMNGMDEAAEEFEAMEEEERLAALGEDGPTPEHELYELTQELEDLQKKLFHVQKRLSQRVLEREGEPRGTTGNV